MPVLDLEMIRLGIHTVKSGILALIALTLFYFCPTDTFISRKCKYHLLLTPISHTHKVLGTIFETNQALAVSRSVPPVV